MNAKQEVAIGSKGNGSVAIGVKAKGGKDKVAALRNQFEEYAARFFDAEFEIGRKQETKLAVLLESADTTHNKEEAILEMRAAWKNVAIATGSSERVASTYASEAKRITEACFLSVAVKTDKDGKVTYHKLKVGEKGKSGKALMSEMGYVKAKTLAATIRKLNGIKSKNNPNKVPKIWTRLQLWDAIKECIDHARKMPDVDTSVVVRLSDIYQAVKAPAGKGKAKTEPAIVLQRNSNAPVLTNQYGKAVVKGSKAWQQMSRGQKAAATRRAHSNGTATIQ